LCLWEENPQSEIETELIRNKQKKNFMIMMIMVRALGSGFEKNIERKSLE